MNAHATTVGHAGGRAREDGEDKRADGEKQQRRGRAVRAGLEHARERDAGVLRRRAAPREDARVGSVTKGKGPGHALQQVRRYAHVVATQGNYTTRGWVPTRYLCAKGKHA